MWTEKIRVIIFHQPMKDIFNHISLQKKNMSGGGGFIFDMIARIRENEESRKSSHLKREHNSMQKILHKTAIKYEELSEEELEKIRLQIKKQHKVENRMMVLKLIITLGLCLLVCYGFYTFVMCYL